VKDLLRFVLHDIEDEWERLLQGLVQFTRLPGGWIPTSTPSAGTCAGHIMKRSSFPGSPTACWTKSSKETQHSALHGGYVKEVKKLYARRNA